MAAPRVTLIKKTNRRDGKSQPPTLILSNTKHPLTPPPPAIAAYGAVLRKYNFKPFLNGPWTVIDELVHGGEHWEKPLRWRYEKEDPSKDSKPVVAQRRVKLQRGQVDAKDVGNDTEYLVSEGVPAWWEDAFADVLVCDSARSPRVRRRRRLI